MRIRYFLIPRFFIISLHRHKGSWHFLRTLVQKIFKRLASLDNYSYLCTVRTNVLTTPLSAGSKTLSPLLHFRSHLFGWLLFFIEFPEKPVKCRILNQSTFDGNGFVPLKYEHFYCISAFLEERLNVRS